MAEDSKFEAIKSFFFPRKVRDELITEIGNELRAELHKENMFGDPKVANETGRRKISLFLTCMRVANQNVDGAIYLFERVVADPRWAAPDDQNPNSSTGRLD
jgi:hypothetical protein